MKRRNQSTLCMMFLVCMMVLALIPANKAEAASKKAKNKAAHQAYQKLLPAIAQQNIYDFQNSFDIEYYCLDVTGDGVDELMVEFKEMYSGSAMAVRFYTYKKGKTKCILNTAIYGLDNFKYYKKTKSITFDSYGHGNEVHTYFKYSKGKYKKIAEKGRRSVLGGNGFNGPWYYYNGSDKEISASKFNKSVKKLVKGGKKKVAHSKLKPYIYYR